MPIIVFKNAGCILHTDKEDIELQGYYALNSVTANQLANIRLLNPVFNLWVDAGAVTVSQKSVNVDDLKQADGENQNAAIAKAHKVNVKKALEDVVKSEPDVPAAAREVIDNMAGEIK